MFWIVFALGSAATIAFDRAAKHMGRIPMDAWLASVKQCKYKYAWDGTGIAIDPASKTLFVAGRFSGKSVTREYKLSDIREWAYEIPGATMVKAPEIIGGGLHGASRNMGASIGETIANSSAETKALEETGLTLTVRDIEYPKWFVKFKRLSLNDKNAETELARWMEILRQTINEG